MQISIPDGLSLFSGQNTKVKATGIEYKEAGQKWDAVDMSVARDSVIPRVDSYYYKIFIMADRLLGGEKHLAI